MNETNYIKLEFPSRSSNEGFARAAAAAFAAQLDPNMEELVMAAKVFICCVKLASVEKLLAA